MSWLILLFVGLGMLFWGWNNVRMPSSGYLDIDAWLLRRAVAGLVAFVVAGVCALVRAFS